MLPSRGNRQIASSVLASLRSSGEGGWIPSTFFGFDALDHRAVRLEDHREGKAEEHRAGVHEVAKNRPVRVIQDLGAIDVGRHELGFAGKRRALQLPIGTGNSHGISHEILDRSGEPRIKAAFQRKRRHNRNQNRRNDGHKTEKTYDSDVKSSGRCAGPPLTDQPLCLPGDNPDEQENEGAVEHEIPRSRRNASGESGLGLRAPERSPARNRARREPRRGRASRIRVGWYPGPGGERVDPRNASRRRRIENRLSRTVMHQHNTVVK